GVGGRGVRGGRREREGGGRARAAHGGRRDSGRARARAALPHHPRREQGAGRARRALQRDPGLGPRGRAGVIATIRDKALAGKRLDRVEGRWLLDEAPLLELGALAAEARYSRYPEKVVTFVIDSN